MGLDNGPDVGPRWGVRWRGLRVAAGVGLVLAYVVRATLTAGFLVVGYPWLSLPVADPVADSERRLRQVDELLPPRGVVGYRGMGPLRVGRNHELVGDDNVISWYVLAQFVLAPRVLDLDADRVRGPVVRDGIRPAVVSPRGGP